jgi:hypothetical protein
MRRVSFVVLLAVAAGLFSTPLRAQTLAAGPWFGSMQPPDVPEPFRISFEVSYDGDVLRIVAQGGDNSLELNEARFEDGNLVYWFQPGPRVDCVLEPDGTDTYVGDCSDSDGATGHMMITRDESRVAGLKSVEEMEGGGGSADH